MKAKDCICGRGEECKGVSAAFYILDDPRSGYTQVPQFRPNTESFFDVESNRLRDSLLRHILPVNKLFPHDPILYIANHHFHPKLVAQSSKGIKCTLPVSISEEEARDLNIEYLDPHDAVLDHNGNPTGEYYVVPNYSFHKTKKLLKKAAKQRRKTPSEHEKHHQRRHASRRRLIDEQSEEKDDLVGMIIVVEIPINPDEHDFTADEKGHAQRAQRIVDEFQEKNAKQKSSHVHRRSERSKSPRRQDHVHAENDSLPPELRSLVMQMEEEEPFAVFDNAGEETNLGMEAEMQAHAARMQKEMSRLKQLSNDAPGNGSSRHVTAALAKLQQQLQQMEHEQQKYLSSREAQKQELLQLIEGVEAKQHQVFDENRGIPDLDAHLDKLEQQLEEATYEASAPATKGENLIRVQEQLLDMEVEQEQYLVNRRAQKQQVLNLIQGVEAGQDVGDLDESFPERSFENTAETNCDSHDEFFQHSSGGSLIVRHTTEPNVSLKTLPSGTPRRVVTPDHRDRQAAVPQKTDVIHRSRSQHTRRVNVVSPLRGQNHDRPGTKSAHSRMVHSSRAAGGSLPRRRNPVDHGEGNLKPDSAQNPREAMVAPKKSRGQNHDRLARSERPARTEHSSKAIAKGVEPTIGMHSSREKSRPKKNIEARYSVPSARAVGGSHQDKDKDSHQDKDTSMETLFPYSTLKITSRKSRHKRRKRRHKDRSHQDRFMNEGDEWQKDAGLKSGAFRSMEENAFDESPKGLARQMDLSRGLMVFETSLIAIQSCVRSFLASREFQRKRNASIQIQSIARGMYVRRGLFLCQSSATIIQSMARGSAAKNDYHVALLGITRLQATARGLEQRSMLKERLMQRHYCAIVTQSMIRRYLAVRRYQAVLRGIVLLQASARGAAERDVATEISAAMIMQSIVRAHLAGLAFRRQKKACIIIQSRTRGMLERSSFVVQVKDAVTIQAAIRRHIALNKYQTALNGVVLLQASARGASQRKALSAEVPATLILQSVVRSFLAYTAFQRQRRACIIIQSRTRGMLERSKLDNPDKNAVAIQTAIRRYFALRDYQTVLNGIVLLQASARGAAQRDAALEMSAAVIVQSVVRSFLAYTAFQGQRRACIIIQSRTRGMLERSKLDNPGKNAVAIQTALRRYFAVRNYQTVLNGIVLLQASARGASERDVALEMSAAVIVQSVVRTFLAEAAYRQQKNACIRIQSRIRGMLVRNKVIRSYEDAAAGIQAVFRRYLAMHRYQTVVSGIVLLQASARGAAQRDAATMISASLLIQSVVRAFLARVTFMRERNAITLVQSTTRGFLVRDKLEEFRRCAVIIQSTVRRFLVVLEHPATSPETKNAVVIQSAVRAFLYSANFHRQRQAAISIQSVSRGMLKRMDLDRLLLCAVVIQSVIRRYLAMKRFGNAARTVSSMESAACGASEVDTQAMTSNAAVVQSVARAFIASNSFQRQRNASVLIQKVTRGMLDRHLMARLHENAIVIQAMGRCHVAMRKKDAATRGITLLQATARACIASASFERQRNASIVIESATRGMLARKKFVAVRSESIVIQAATRRYLAMCKYRVALYGFVLLQASARGASDRNVATEISATLILQSVVRTFLATIKFRKQRCASVSIQSAARGMLQRRRVKIFHVSAVAIQSAVRRYLATLSQQNFAMEQRKAAKVLQSAARGMLERRRINKLHAYATAIQAVLRSYIARLKYLAATRGVLLLQASARGITQRKTNRKMVASVIVIQSFLRVFLAVSTVHTMRQAAVNIQSCARGKLVRVELERRAVCSVSIQLMARRYLAMRQYQKLTHGMVILQATARGISERKAMSKKKSGLVVIQSVVRAYLAFTLFRRQKNASVILQRAVRGMLERKKYASLYACIVTIQTAIRRYLEACKHEDSTRQQALIGLSRGETYAHMLALESKRRSTYDRKLESCALRWRSSLELLRAGVHETGRAERLILGSAIVNQACADAMQAICKDVLLDDEGNAVADEGKQIQLMEHRSQHLTNSVANSGKSDDASSKRGQGDILKSLMETQGALAEQFVESANFVVSEVTEEVTRFRELLQVKVNDLKALGDSTIDELEGAEVNVLETWDAYDAVAGEEQVSSRDLLAGPAKRRSSIASTGSEGCADLWLLEMRYRFAVAHQSSLWQKAPELFQIVLKTESERRARLKEMLLDYVPRQRRLFSISASTQAQVLQELMDRPSADKDIEHEVKAVFEKYSSTRHTNGDDSPFLNDHADDVSCYDEFVTIDSPLASRLVRSSTVIEMKPIKDRWQTVLAVITADSFLHLFGMLTSEGEKHSTNEFVLQLPGGSISGGHHSAQSSAFIGILRDPSPSETLYLPNCAVTCAVDDQRYLFLTETRVGRFGNTTTRKLLLRTASLEDTESWLTALNNGQPLEPSDIMEETDPSALERIIAETNVPGKDVFDFAHGAAEFISTTDEDTDDDSES